MALIVVFVAYRWMLGAAEVYGVLVESTFDVHRLLLYKSLQWPLPADSVEERRAGKELTKYLFLGAEPDQAIPLVTSAVTASRQSPRIVKNIENE